jgi:hypothetical protein
MRRPAPTRTAVYTVIRRWSRQALPVVATFAAVVLLAVGVSLIPTPIRHYGPGNSPTRTTSPSVVVWRALPETDPTIPTTITSPSPDPSRAAGLRPCRSGDLQVSARDGVAGGTRTIEVLYQSDEPCQVNGYPQITPLGLNGRPVAVPVERELPAYGNPVALGPGIAVVRLAWTSLWCADEVEVATILVVHPEHGGSTVEGFGRSQCYGRPESGEQAPITVSEFRPEHFTTGQIGTPYDEVAVDADLPATAKLGETITFRVTLTAPRHVALDPCPDLSITFGDRAAYGLNCDGVPYRDGAGRPYLPAGIPVTFVARAMAPTTAGRNVKVTWQLEDTSAVGGGTVEVLAVR